MLVKKITFGYVVQTFDIDTGICTGQSFMPDPEVDRVVFKSEDEQPYVNSNITDELYFPFTMIQKSLSMVGGGFGYSFKDGAAISAETIETIGRELARLNGFVDMHAIDSKLSLDIRVSDGVHDVFGMGNPDNVPDKQDIGTVWAKNKEHLIEALTNAGVERFYPYRFPEDRGNCYVLDGELYVRRDVKHTNIS